VQKRPSLTKMTGSAAGLIPREVTTRRRGKRPNEPQKTSLEETPRGEKDGGRLGEMMSRKMSVRCN
jgi:hypothetical protein